MQSAPPGSLRTMVARISADDIVIYANAALSSYLGVRKRDLVGTPLEVLSRRAKGEISSCFARPDTGRSSNHLVTDDAGRVFEVKVYSDGGVLDIVLDEVTNAESIGRELRDASGTAFESLSEDELRTTRHPERRYLTVSYTRLVGVPQLTERLAPMEVRLMVNSFVEEASDAVFETGCTVGETWGDTILGIYGAPRYYTDHPLRAILAACDQMRKTAQLHAGFHREGKELPPNTCGIWTGDVTVGTLGNSAWQHYTALGLPVVLAQKLAELARPGEILLPEHTLTHLLRVLPEEWEHVRAESEFEPDLSDFQWSGDDIAPVAEHLRKVVYLVGRGVQEHADQVELYFNYLWALKIPGREQHVPILSVTRPMEIGDSLELSDDNVVTTQVVQTLGKYKLIAVIGSGGMGKVWRGVDRFGNTVAIKVLHSGENVTDATLKRFRREAEIMARLPHRNICRVYEMNEFDGIQYLAMEFVDGLTLSDLLYEKVESETATTSAKVDLKSLIHSIRSGRSSRASVASALGESVEGESSIRSKTSRILPVEQTLSVILKVCEAVQFAHEHGVLHRDLKPGNILLREDGEPLVADFGLAKLNTADATHSLSMTGHVVGTLENMSPEQAESSKTVDERADVYSLGTILYQMLTGRRHFEATGNIVADAQALHSHEPVRPRALNPKIDLDLEIITLKALRNDPVERYRSVAALQADLERYKRGEVISAKPVSPKELLLKLVQRNRTVSAVVAGALLIFVIGVIVVILLQNTAYERLSSAMAEARRQASIAEEKARLADAATAESKEKSANLEAQAGALRAANDKLVQVNKDLTAAQTAANLAQASADEAKDKEKAATKTAEEKNREAAEKSKEAEQLKEELAKKEEAQRELEEAKRAAMNGERVGPRGFQRPEEGAGGMPAPPMEAVRNWQEAQRVFFLGQLDDAAYTTPEQAVSKLSDAMEDVSKALAIQSNMTPAMMLKGRIHLSFQEYDQAAECFAKAAELIRSGAPPLPDGENPDALVQMMAKVAKEPGDKFGKITEALRTMGGANDKNRLIMVNVAKARHPTLATSANPFGRPISTLEITNELRMQNGADTQVFVKIGLDNKPIVIIWNNEKLLDLKALKQLDPSSVAIVGAKIIDWPSLKELRSLTSLDVSKSVLTNNLPADFARSFGALQSLNLSDTDLGSLEFLRSMGRLRTLNVSNTEVTDLSPLVQCIGIHDLDVSGLNPTNFQALFRLPLQSLTVSPLLITDKAGLNSLRTLRSLIILRTPSDVVGLPTIKFWDKLDRGEYNQSN